MTTLSTENKDRFYIEFKVEGSDLIQRTNTVAASEKGARQKVRSLFGKGIKVEFVEVINYKDLD